jgi:hypothetical protein
LRGLAKESTVLLSLLRNLDPLAADIARIGATDRLKNLENANQAYADLQFERYIEKVRNIRATSRRLAP